MITVKAFKNENIESLFSRFKRKCKDDKLFLRITEKEFFIKPSQKRRNKQKRLKHDNF